MQNNDFNEKTTELIELANENSSMEQWTAEPYVPEASFAESEPVHKKGPGTGAKILIAIVGVILALVIALFGTCCGVLSCASRDDMPDAPEAAELDVKEFGMNAAKEVLEKKTLTIDSSTVDSLLLKVKDTVNASTDLISVEDLFCELGDDSGTIYARVHVDTVDVNGFSLKLNRTFAVHADFNIGYDDEADAVKVQLGNVYCGGIKIPSALIDSVLGSVQFPAGVSRAGNGDFLYDMSGLNTMLDDMIKQVIEESLANSFWSFASQFLGDAAASLVEVDLNNAEISDGKIIISGTVSEIQNLY